MSLDTVSTYGLTIVLNGNFNPPIINPTWLAFKKLIRESEAENADLKIIHKEVSHFLLTFVEILVTKDQFKFLCHNKAEFHLVKDLACSIFSIINETPVTAIGLNHILDFSLTNKKTYNHFGNWLAPQSIWSDVLESPKLLDLTYTEPFNDEKKIKCQVSITPSNKVKPFGVRMQLNYHINAKEPNLNFASELISNNWDKSFKKIDSIYTNILIKFKNETK